MINPYLPHYLIATFKILCNINQLKITYHIYLLPTILANFLISKMRIECNYNKIFETKLKKLICLNTF